MKNTRRKLTVEEKHALIFRFLDLQEGDTGPRSRALSATEEGLLSGMAQGSLSPEALAKCEAMLLGNRVALDFMAEQLRAGKDAAPRLTPSRRNVLS